MADGVEIIQAAGAVLWRKDAANEIEVALVHRPRYDDWSIPKGKLEIGESHIACAYRELLEETGITAIFGPEIGHSTYEVVDGRKVVRYWSAQASGEPHGERDLAEIDEIQWLSPTAAKKKLTRKDDRKIVDFFLDFGPDTTPLIMLRHAKAVKRDEWGGDDGDRPLDVVGQKQSKRLLPSFLPFGITEVHSSDAIRCLETVAPLVRALDIKMEISEDLSEYGYVRNKELAHEYIQNLVGRNVAALVCSHNPVIPKLVKKLIGKRNFRELDGKLNPCDAWVLHHRDGEIVAIDFIEAPTI
ncbi:MAG TPA: NUDIX domain-containing protein [Candidatus Nanopelagicaceae bacterium]